MNRTPRTVSSSKTISIVALIWLGFTGAAMAETENWTKRVPVQIDAEAIPLDVAVTDAENNASQEEVWSDIGTERWARNVTTPTLLAVLPEPDKATGAGVLVVPGGGFQFVSIDNEGYRIAERLAANGIAAFILKYRVMETPASETDFADYIGKVFAGEAPYEGFDSRDGIPAAVADAQAALNVIATRSAEWGVDMDRLGMLGFSAGAVTTLSVTLDQDGPQPDFIGYIYGPTNLSSIPSAPPAMFAALAADDGLFANQGLSFIEGWQAAGGPVEFHLYETGGHGFGSYQRGVTADAWFEQFVLWMRARGELSPTADD